MRGRTSQTLGWTSILILVTVAQPSLAQEFNWTAAVSNFWGTAGNWSPSGPPTGSQRAVFTGSTPGFLANVNSNVSLGGLIFRNTSSTQEYTILGNAGNTMTLTGSTSILVEPTVADLSVHTIDLNNGSGALLVPGGTPLTIVNRNQPLITLTSDLVLSTTTALDEVSGSSALVVSGFGRTFINGPNRLSGGFTKRDRGALYIAGSWAAAAGGSRLAGGAVHLDYSAAPDYRLPTGTLILEGASLDLSNSGSTNSFTETTGSSTVLNPGFTTLNINQASGTALGIDLGALTTTGGTLRIDGSGFARTSSPLTNGILGGHITRGSANWATKDASNNIIPLSAYAVNTYGPGINTLVTADNGLSATTNSLNFDSALTSVFYPGIVIQSGGMLIRPNRSEELRIDGSLITTGNTPFYVHQNSPTYPVRLAASLSSAGGLVKTGSGDLILLGQGVAGPISIQRGLVIVRGFDALSSTSGISFYSGDFANGTSYRELAIELGDSVEYTITRPIQLHARSILSTGSSENSRITFSGAISSGAGLSTILELNSESMSGINLTGLNTFTGSIFLNGTLGIQSNQNLGNSSNVLTINESSLAQSTLEFLGNANLSRPVELAGTAYILTPAFFSGTISGTLSGPGLLHKQGLGVLTLAGANTHSGGFFVEVGTLNVSNTASFGPTSNDLTINAGAVLGLTGGTASTGSGRDIRIGPASGNGLATIQIPAGAELTIPSAIANRTGGVGGLEKTGAGTLTLTGANSYSGGTYIRQGTLQVSTSLGAASGSVTVDALGLLRYTTTNTTGRTFILNNGTLDIPSGVSLTLNGATIGGGFLRGNGAYNLTGGTSLTGVTTFTSTTMNVTGPASATNFSNNGAITVNAGQTFGMNYATNGAAGRVTVNGTMNTSDFVSYGQLTVPAGGLINNTLSNMVLGGGSTTFVGSVANPGGKIDLGGQQLLVRGGLLVTNSGSFGSGNGVRNGVTVADYGALVKGTGPYQSVITQNGGQYLPGNSPGTSEVGDFAINGGGGLIFQITDAGPSLTFPSAPGVAGMNPGWGLTKVFTSLNFTATPASPYTITMQTQQPPPAAPDTPGLMSSFDPTRAYQWLIFDLQPGASFTGTFDPAAINFATSQFVNSTAGGTFSLSFNGTNQVFLNFTPVPEPVHILALAAGGVLVGGAIRRGRRARRAHV